MRISIKTFWGLPPHRLLTFFPFHTREWWFRNENERNEKAAALPAPSLLPPHGPLPSYSFLDIKLSFFFFLHDLLPWHHVRTSTPNSRSVRRRPPPPFCPRHLFFTNYLTPLFTLLISPLTGLLPFLFCGPKKTVSFSFSLPCFLYKYKKKINDCLICKGWWWCFFVWYWLFGIGIVGMYVST